jgi:alpha-amylase
MYFTIKDVYRYGKSMKNISSRYQEEDSAFVDVSALGVFVDNHDNPRFLYNFGNHSMFKNALTFSLLARGIPIVYYGSEQGFGGGADPGNREQLWTNFDTSTDMYVFIKTLNAARKVHKPYNYDHKEIYVLDNLYCWYRGDMLACTTNQMGATGASIPNLPFSEGERICNIFNTSDCISISGGKGNISLNNGEVKVYVPAGSQALLA